MSDKLPYPAGKKVSTVIIRSRREVMEAFLDPQEILGEMTKQTIMGLINSTEDIDSPISILIQPLQKDDPAYPGFRIDAKQEIAE